MSGSFTARDEYVATSGQTVFTITFPFLDSTHINVEIEGVDVSTFTITNATTMTMDSGVTEDDTVHIIRRTPHTALVAFTGGVPVTLENMETQRKQFTYISEEQADDLHIVDDAMVTKLSELDIDTVLDMGLHSIVYQEQVVATPAGFATLDWTLGNKAVVTLNEASTNFTFLPPSGSGDTTGLELTVIQDGSGSRQISWPATVKWPGGTQVVLSTAPGAIDVITFHFRGAIYLTASIKTFS